jgi:hypothetical protein
MQCVYEVKTVSIVPINERVLFWRAEVLERAGYEDGAVVQLAARADIDLHLAVKLVARGCPHETALRILL